MKQKELIRKVRKLVKEGHNIDRTGYIVKEKYGYNIIDSLIKLEIPGLGSKGVKTKYTDRVFANILKACGIEDSVEVMTDELGWEDSLRWLFTHYKYGKDDNSNSICVNSSGQIIGVQYNGCKTTTIIKSFGCFVTKDFIVVNSDIKLKGKYSISDAEELIEYIKLYFNNKENEI